MRHPGEVITWRPTLGAWREGDRVRFRVWAPDHDRLAVVHRAQNVEVWQRLERCADGTHTGSIAGCGAGTRYCFELPDGRRLPDPASRFQPEGVHGLSEVIDPDAFEWTDQAWRGIPLSDAIIYELHVGTFTPEGTFAGVATRLEYLKDLGITAIELMPVAEFAGRRNWGYDGVDLFAPSHRYGRPEDLQRLVDRAHRIGLAVILDVVYNHFGPDGAYAGAFSPYYFTDRHQTPWGPALNLHGPHAEHVREFFVQNALHWIHEYHVDGLRLDATHELYDRAEHSLLSELADAVHGATDGRAIVIAEDDRNCARLAMPRDEGGDGLHALWADDFHHHVRRAVAGDANGYFRGYSGSIGDLAETIRRGWYYCGQVAPHTGAPRGSDPCPLRLEQFVFCLQNHDQVGNRALGDRLHHAIPPALYRAVAALFACVPQTPLVFMGQEWGASTPFQFFTDHIEELGRAITDGRRAEFAAFDLNRDGTGNHRTPDPQAAETFERSRLNWSEIVEGRHRALWRLHRALFKLRPALLPASVRGRADVHVDAVDDSTIAVWQGTRSESPVLIVTRFGGRGSVTVSANGPTSDRLSWTTVLTTNDQPFACDGAAVPEVRTQSDIQICYDGPATVVLRGCAYAGSK